MGDNKIPVVLTTSFRGVIFAFIDPSKKFERSMEVTNARFCVYWSADMRGLLGLCTQGPSKTCKIGPAVPWTVLHEITGIFPVTPEASKAWEKAPWG